MRAILHIGACIFMLVLLGGCTSKKKPSLAGEEPVEVEDFIDFFPSLDKPLQLEDTFLLRKDDDSLRISRKVFTQFVPDSVQQALWESKTTPKYYPIGKIQSQETYLLVKLVNGQKKTAMLLAFDKKNQFIAAMNFLSPDNVRNTREYSIFGRKEEITKATVRRNDDGTQDEGKEIFILNSADSSFLLIQTDAMDKRPSELINPIDTLGKKMKYTADYGTGKMNLFSFRDGRKSDRLNFYIHFEKNNGDCIGELKGEAIWKSANKAEYREPGELCALQFSFTSSSVTIKELEPCGSRRGLRCSFDGNYPRKKETKPKTSKKKK